MINNWNDVKAAWSDVKVRVTVLWNLRWVRLTALALAVPLVLLAFATGYYYVSFARLIDARLHGERATVLPARVRPAARAAARPVADRTRSSSTG